MSETPSDDVEGRPGVGRVEAFSDGVIAIIVTIMVLELHPPISEGMDKLWTLWPVFTAYVLSYVYVAIYWVNHHRLFSHATQVRNGLLWSNILLLFGLSLIPFSTSYLGEHRFSRDATILWLVSALFPAIAYSWLQSIIRRTGVRGPQAEAYHVAYARKGLIATLIYLAGIALSFITPWLGIACAVAVAILWFLPHSRLDLLLVDDRRARRQPHS